MTAGHLCNALLAMVAHVTQCAPTKVQMPCVHEIYNLPKQCCHADIAKLKCIGLEPVLRDDTLPDTVLGTAIPRMVCRKPWSTNSSGSLGFRTGSIPALKRRYLPMLTPNPAPQKDALPSIDGVCTSGLGWSRKRTAQMSSCRQTTQILTAEQQL